MSDVQTPVNAPNAEQAIASLKKQADLLGVQYKSNTSVATLQKAIQDKLAEPIGGASSEDKAVSGSALQAEGAGTEDNFKAAMKLHRVIITPMEATKASNLDSELFCAGNSLVGTVKRTIPFGEPWHVEAILLHSIKEKKYQMFISKKTPQGVPHTTAKLVPAYSIAFLDPLTPAELDALADHQIRTRSLEDE